MMRRGGVLPIAVTLGLSAALAAIILVAGMRWGTPRPLSGPIADGGWTARTRAWFVPRGFYPAEADVTRGLSFSWTSAHAELRVPAIDRSQAYRIGFRVAAGRGPDLPPPPELSLSVDGVVSQRVQTKNEPATYEVVAPPRADSTLRVALDLSNTFVPGQDRRTLGVRVEGVTIEPIGGSFRPLIRVVLLGTLATLAYVAVALLCGLAPAWAVVVAVVAAGLQAWLLAEDAAFLGTFINDLVRLAAAAVVTGSVVAVLRWQWPLAASAPEWGTAVGLVLIASMLEFAFFHHPRATIGDSIFQVHRAQYVAGGHYFFTSVTPRPFFEFPYAIALYVNAMPFWNWFPGELDRVLLLRGLTISANGLVGVAMYFALRRGWGHAWPALMFAVLWPFARAPIQALCTSNLTNLYGQGVFGVGMGMLGWMASPRRSTVAGARQARTTASWVVGASVLAGLLSVGFLSHFSTLSVGVPLVGLVGVLLVVVGRGEHRRLGLWVLLALLLAAAVSYALYYSHFHEVYRATIERVAAREGEAETRSMVAPVGVKMTRWLAETTLNFGVPLGICALAGAVWLGYRRPKEGFTTVLMGWGGAWLIFSALGILTAIEMRSNLATAPLLLALACFALGSLAQTSRVGAGLASLAALAIAWDGLADWMMCLTGHR